LAGVTSPEAAGGGAPPSFGDIAAALDGGPEPPATRTTTPSRSFSLPAVTTTSSALTPLTI
jgi:hypothetical protein